MIAGSAFFVPAVIAQAQLAPNASIAEMASTPLVRLTIAESLRTPPDEASITVGTRSNPGDRKADEIA
jgi:hypothetical protein